MTIEHIKTIIAKGEGLTVEFKKAKHQLPNNLFETVCAFLNRSGGEIILGVQDDTTIDGVDENIAEQLCKEIANLSNNPQKLFPSFLLEPQMVDFKGKKLIYIFVPVSSQIHKTAGKIFDRSVDGDFILQSDEQIKHAYGRKSTEYSENKIYPFLTIHHLDEVIVEKVRKLIRINRSNHPWNDLSYDEFFKV